MRDATARVDSLLTQLRQRHCRVTPQRVALIRLLAESHDHPSAGGLYERIAVQFPGTSLGTVYKTLALLGDMGEVLTLTLNDGIIHYDVHRPYAHPHLICRCCHKVIDAPPEFESSAIAEPSEPAGFRIDIRQLDLYGLCSDCTRGAMV